MKVKIVIEAELDKSNDAVIKELERMVADHAPVTEAQHILLQMASVKANQIRVAEVRTE